MGDYTFPNNVEEFGPKLCNGKLVLASVGSLFNKISSATQPWLETLRPRNENTNKDINLVIWCPSANSSRTKLWKQNMNSIRKVSGSCPYVRQNLKQGLEQWLANEHVRWEGSIIPQSSNMVGYLTFEAYMNQMDFGWDQAFSGRLSFKWKLTTIAYNKERD